MTIHIETDRFILRDIEMTDAPGILALDSDPEVHRYLDNDLIGTTEEAEAIITHVRKQYKDNGIGRWAIIAKATNEFVGWTGLKFEEGVRTEFSYYDLGYRLRPKFWGQGIATETALLSLKYGFTELELAEICAAADVENVGSNKVLQKAGLRWAETFDFEGTPHHWYTIRQADWLANNL